MNYNYIAIEGNIGVGKTTLCHHLSQEFDVELILEQFEDNNFLPKFYKDPERYAFPLEVSFLADRYQQIRSKTSQPDLFKDFLLADYSFARSLVFSGVTLNQDEYRLFYNLYKALNDQLPQPDLLIFLYASVEKLQSNIQHRGRSYEQSITADYLSELHESYQNLLQEKKEQLPILLVNVTHCNYDRTPNPFYEVIDSLEQTYPPGIHRMELH